jgi:hypothetical protein
MSRIAISIACAALIFFVTGCGEDMPASVDGNGRLTFMVVDTTGLLPGGTPGTPMPLDSTEVSLKSRSHEFSVMKQTDADGMVAFDGLVSGWYEVFARKEAVIENNEKLFTGGFDLTLKGYEEIDSTVTVNLISTSDLMINEIFYAGSDASSFYFYDQYVELYNASADTAYLDGMIITRQLQSAPADMDEVSFVRAIYAYQFPGTPVTGRQYPIAPGQFMVIAADAVNHTQWCKLSIDLSHADWEFFNPLSSDYDNPAVPNLVNINPASKVDYLINLVHGGVCLCTGAPDSFTYGPDEEGNMRFYIEISSVVDGVEYASSSTSTKEVTARVDAGFAGVGNTRYSQQSAERRVLGLDTNDSSFDFVLTKSTPGYTHAQ